MVAGQRRGLTPTMRREYRRRNGLEATIGHAKFDHRMDRNYLLDHLGDAINALAAPMATISAVSISLRLRSRSSASRDGTSINQFVVLAVDEGVAATIRGVVHRAQGLVAHS